MARDAPLVRISNALILSSSQYPGGLAEWTNLLGRIQPRYTKDTHAKASEEREEERDGDNTELVRVTASFSTTLKNSDHDPA